MELQVFFNVVVRYLKTNLIPAVIDLCQVEFCVWLRNSGY